MCKEHTPFYSAGAYENPKTKLIIGDAKAGLEDCPDGSIDVIICDLSDPLDGGPCYQLYTTSSTPCARTSSRPGAFSSRRAAARACAIAITSSPPFITP